MDGPAYLTKKMWLTPPTSIRTPDHSANPLVPSSTTLLCPAEFSLSPLSSRWKAEGNGSHTGNIRTGTQPLHLQASHLSMHGSPKGPHSAQNLEREDLGLDWLYLACQCIQPPNPQSTLLTLYSHGRLNHRPYFDFVLKAPLNLFISLLPALQRKNGQPYAFCTQVLLVSGFSSFLSPSHLAMTLNHPTCNNPPLIPSLFAFFRCIFEQERQSACWVLDNSRL